MTPGQILERVYQISPDRPLRTLWRSAGYALRPPRPRPFLPAVAWRQRRLLETGAVRAEQAVRVLWERRPGPVPTIVLGGFVPDATESVFLQRGLLLRHGSVYYFNYSPHGFSRQMLFAQLEDLLEELHQAEGRQPVLLGISFGSGLLLEWLRHLRQLDLAPRLRGIVMVSPVTCPADIVDAGAPKPTTLLGRALQPFLAGGGPRADDRHIEKCRSLLLRMFESGAQNKRALREVMTLRELVRIRNRVVATLQEVTKCGAVERVAALADMEAPGGNLTLALAPLCQAPVLVLFAEKETSVLVGESPTAAFFGEGAETLFPSCQVRVVKNPRGSPVQHASLLFHSFNFSPPIARFYRRLRQHARIQQPRPGAAGTALGLARGIARALAHRRAA